eukprot:4019869-Amphidinium_carterae.1
MEYYANIKLARPCCKGKSGEGKDAVKSVPCPPRLQTFNNAQRCQPHAEQTNGVYALAKGAHLRREKVVSEAVIEIHPFPKYVLRHCVCTTWSIRPAVTPRQDLANTEAVTHFRSPQ